MHVVEFVTAPGNKDLRRRFCGPPKKHDGLWIEEYMNWRERQLLHFIVPIFSPDKSMTCTMKLTRAIEELYSGKLQYSS